MALDVLLVAAFSTTAAFASDPPDSATNPLSGYNEVTDSALTNGNYEVRHAVRPGQGASPQVTILSSNPADDQGPRLAIAPDGDTAVVWWRDGSAGAVLLRERDYSTGAWCPEVTLSLSNEDSRHPRITHDGSNYWVSYLIPGNNQSSMAVLGVPNGPDPWEIGTRTIVATVSGSGDPDPAIAAESGNLWLTWVSSSTQVAWSEYDVATATWGSVHSESYANDTVQAARARVRTAVLNN